MTSVRITYAMTALKISMHKKQKIQNREIREKDYEEESLPQLPLV